MKAGYDYYTKKLNKFRQEPEKLRRPGIGYRTPGKISLGGLVKSTQPTQLR